MASPGPMILRIKRKRTTDVPVDALYLQQALDQAQAESQPTSSVPGTASPSPSPTPQMMRIVQARADAQALRRVTKRRSSARLPLSPSTQALATHAEDSQHVTAQQLAEQEQVAHDQFTGSSRRGSTSSTAASPGHASAPTAPAQPQPQPPSVFRFAETLSSAQRTSRAADQELRKRVTNLQLLRRMEREAYPRSSSTTDTTSGETLPQAESAQPAEPTAVGQSAQPIVPGAAMARDRLHQRLGPTLPPGVHRVAAPSPAAPGPRIIDIVVSEPSRHHQRHHHHHDRQHTRHRQTPAQAQAKSARQLQDDDVDSLGDVFKQMLIEHLMTKNEELPSDLVEDQSQAKAMRGAPPSSSPSTPASLQQPDSSESDSDDDYVYDIYYREDPSFQPPSRMAAAADGASQVGLQPGNVAGREEPTLIQPTDWNGVQSIAALQVPNLTAEDWAVLLQPARYEAERARGAGQTAEDEAWWSSDDEFVDEDYIFARPGEQLPTADEGDTFGFAVPTEQQGDAEEPIGPPNDRVKLHTAQRKRVPAGLEEWDEGEDEDSNEEDYYRNEYPEHELDELDDASDGAGMSSDSDFGY